MDSVLTEKLEKFFSAYRLLLLKKGELVIRPDDNPQGVYFLRNGYVRMYSIFEDGRELTLNIFKPQTYFSMIWTIGNLENTYYFQAMTEAELARAPKEQFLEFIKGNPEIMFDVTRRVLIGLDGLLTNVLHLLSGTAEKRVVAALFLSAKRFGEKNKQGAVIIKLPLTHQDIANLAGITRETTSIEIGKLTKRGLISSRNHCLIINDLKKLEEESFLEKDEEPLPYSL